MVARRHKWLDPWRLTAAAIVVALVTLLAGTDVARMWAVRSYLRLDLAWSEYFPLPAGKPLVHQLTPLLGTLGLLKPVWVDVEPGVRMKLDPTDLVSRTILASMHTRWEPEIWEAMQPRLTPGAVFADVGAHIGYYSLKASVRVGETGGVIAFEPNPSTVSQLREHVSVNRAANVRVMPIACGDRNEVLTLYDGAQSGNSGASSFSSATAASRRGVDVPVRPIDQIARELGLHRLDVMKIDVEGAELLVLKGAQMTIEQFHPLLVIEVSASQLANMGTSTSELESYVRTLGYRHMQHLNDTNEEWTF